MIASTNHETVIGNEVPLTVHLDQSGGQQSAFHILNFSTVSLTTQLTPALTTMQYMISHTMDVLSRSIPIHYSIYLTLFSSPSVPFIFFHLPRVLRRNTDQVSGPQQPHSGGETECIASHFILSHTQSRSRPRGLACLLEYWECSQPPFPPIPLT